MIQSTALVLLFMFSVAPMVLAAFPTSTNDTFSIYNTDYDGLSIVRRELESISNGPAALKYNTTNLISNLNALNRFNGSGALVVVGPAASFEATETFSVLLYLLRGGSLIIADDFGTGNEILEPIFNLFENIDNLCENAGEYGVEIPCLDDILSGANNSTESEDPSSGDNSTLGLDQDIEPDASDIDPSNFLTAILSSVRGFGFNRTGVLMDVESNNENPNRPLITDIDQSEIEGYSFTQGVDKVQMEMGTVISLKLSVEVDLRDGNGDIIYNETSGEALKEKKTVYQPLQKISASLINENIDPDDEAFELSLPFFPLYSSRNSWIETNIQEAADNTAVPNPDEWGNAKFAVALSLPLFPGMGKLVFLADSSIFINRWTEQTAQNDNLKLIRNIIEMATDHQNITIDNPQIPIIFDFGHTFQSLTSPALYSTALLKLIAEMSMFPLYAPFVPLLAYGYGKRLMPKSRRLRPILLTKRRGEGGHSDFDKKLEDIKEAGGYGEPIEILVKKLVREIRLDPRFEGSPYRKDPREFAQFLVDNYKTSLGSRREVQQQLKALFEIHDHPTRRMSKVVGERYLIILKGLLDLVARKA